MPEHPHPAHVCAAWGLAVSLLHPVTGQAATAARSVEDLRTALGEVRKAMEEAEWKTASAELAMVLQRFAGEDVVRGLRGEIIELDRRCRFHAGYEAPDPKTLVSGDIERYMPNSGQIRIRYGSRRWGDFVYADELQPDAKKKPRSILDIAPPKRRTRAEYRFHPAVFQEYTVTLEGDSYSRTSFLVCVNQDSVHEIEVGAPPFSREYDFGLQDPRSAFRAARRVQWLPSTIHRRSGKDSVEELVKKEWGAERKPPREMSRREAEAWYQRQVRFPVKDGKPFKLTVSVSATRITVKSGSRTVVSCNKGRNEHGLFAMRGPDFRSVVFNGIVDRAWIQNKLDHLRNAALARFERSYDPKKVLPAWLFEQAAGAAAAAEHDRRSYPGDEAPDPAEFARAGELIRDHSYRSLLLRLTFTGKAKMPDPVRAFLRARAYLGLGMLEEAEAAAQQCFEADARFYPTLVIRALVAGQQKRFEQEEAWYRRAIELAPNLPTAWSHWIDSLLGRNRAAEAEKILARAILAGVDAARLGGIDAELRKVKSGPNWAQRHTVETAHFHIASDIDEKTCRHAGIVLEQAYEVYAQRLGKVDNGGRRFQVYLFSGRAGFERYCKGLRMDVPVHAAGLYMPRLKQLLIWNLANRAEMMRTIRHEGLHQYLDALLEGPPTWLNEGLAEYFEQAHTERGKPVGGMVQERHLRALALVRERGRPELLDLMRLGYQGFYAKAQINYPMSWALVHFLRHSTRKNRELFDAILSGLDAGEPYQKVLARALKGVDVKALDAGFWEHVQKLRDKRR